MQVEETSIIGGASSPEPVSSPTPDTAPETIPATEPKATPSVPDISATQTSTDSPPNPNNNWMDSLDDDGRSYMDKKGYKSTQDLANGYMHLSKHLGGDAGDLFVINDENPVPEDLYKRLGVPDSADSYSYTDVEGFSGGDRLDSIRSIAHENKISESAFKAVVDGFVSGEIADRQRSQDEFRDKVNGEIEDMRNEMGLDFDKFINQADSAIRMINKDKVIITD